MWFSLHIMAYVYPDSPSAERRAAMDALLSGLCASLPCPGCGVHCQKHMEQTPPDTSSRMALKVWLYDFHNAVNKRTGKRVLSHSEADALVKKHLESEVVDELVRATELRKEDHREMSRLQRLAEGCTSEACDKTAVIVVGSVLVVLVVAMLIVAFMVLRKSF
jgi:hypothetical protein